MNGMIRSNLFLQHGSIASNDGLISLIGMTKGEQKETIQ